MKNQLKLLILNNLLKTLFSNNFIINKLIINISIKILIKKNIFNFVI
jgi:hypothetical protein